MIGETERGTRFKFTRENIKRITRREAIGAWQRERNNKRKITLIEIKGNRCKSCGQSFHQACYHFHHRNPLEKNKKINIYTAPIETIKIELEKCDMLCANCHTIIHFGRPKPRIKS